MNDSPQKRCSKCPNSYPATPEFFSRDRSKKDRLRTTCKICENAQKKRYYEQRKEQMQAKNNAYRESHREHLNEYNRQYHAAYRERENARSSARYQAHKEEAITHSREYYKTHQDKMRDQMRQYRYTERGRAAYRAARHNRKSAKRSVEGTYTATQLQDQLKRQKHKCYYCHTKLAQNIWHADHIVPLTREHSSNTIDNIVITCPTCNLSKGTKLPHEWPQGGRLL